MTITPTSPPNPSPRGQAGPPGRRTVRMRTVVLGLACLAVSAAVLLAVYTDVHVSGRAFALAVLLGAGTLLFLSGARSAFGPLRRSGR